MASLQVFDQNLIQSTWIATENIIAVDETRDRGRVVLVLNDHQDIPIGGYYADMVKTIFGDDYREVSIEWHDAPSAWMGRRAIRKSNDRT